MKVIVAGGTGFIGEPLVKRLVERGDDVSVLTRNPAKVKIGRGVLWDGRTQGAWSEAVATADAVVNLAGENVGEGRWTEERKRRLVASRLDATGAIVEALRGQSSRKRVLVNASAVGYYGVRGDEVLDENASRGAGFLADLVDRWEAAARTAEASARVVLLRFGVILAPDGGALKKLLLPFRMGLGGPVGNGRQWMSWVDRDDAIRFILWSLDQDAAQGVYNVTSPAPVRNAEFTRALGQAVHRPAVLPAPGFALRVAFGQMADEMLLGGQRVVPERAHRDGFSFEAPSLAQSLARQV
jgi:uncharacterized protein (TIGR01777 family)